MFIEKISILDNDLTYALKMQLRLVLCVMHLCFEKRPDKFNNTHIMSCSDFFNKLF